MREATEVLIDPSDIFAAEPHEKTQAALEQFRLEAVRSDVGPAFEEAYGALADEFAARGELERREVITDRLRGPMHTSEPAATVTYHLVAARDPDGRLAAVRDAFVCIHDDEPLCLVFLSHTLVLPAYRRTGIAALMRALPVTLARRGLTDAGRGLEKSDVVLFAEMDPIHPTNRATVIRLLAYARSGFSAVPPTILPYCQPDFRYDSGSSAGPLPIPFIPVIRWLGHEERRLAPSRLIEASVRHVYAVYGLHTPQEHIESLREHALSTLAASRLVQIPLIALPRDVEELSRVQSLLRSAVLPLFPESIRGARPLPAQSPEQELTQLLETWRSEAL